VYFSAQARCVEIQTGQDSGELLDFKEWETEAYAKVVETRQNLLNLSRRLVQGLWGAQQSKIVVRLRGALLPSR